MAETRALRADYARDLLLTTDLPLKEITVKTELGDEYALSRVFRHCFGIPPGAFHKRHEHFPRSIYHESVRKGEAGKLARLYKLQPSGLFEYA